MDTGDSYLTSQTNVLQNKQGVRISCNFVNYSLNFKIFFMVFDFCVFHPIQ